MVQEAQAAQVIPTQGRVLSLALAPRYSPNRLALLVLTSARRNVLTRGGTLDTWKTPKASVSKIILLVDTALAKSNHISSRVADHVPPSFESQRLQEKLPSRLRTWTNSGRTHIKQEGMTRSPLNTERNWLRSRVWTLLSEDTSRGMLHDQRPFLVADLLGSIVTSRQVRSIVSLTIVSNVLGSGGSLDTTMDLLMIFLAAMEDVAENLSLWMSRSIS